jgi:hypothetical protein
VPLLHYTALSGGKARSPEKGGSMTCNVYISTVIHVYT